VTCCTNERKQLGQAGHERRGGPFADARALRGFDDGAQRHARVVDALEYELVHPGEDERANVSGKLRTGSATSDDGGRAFRRADSRDDVRDRASVHIPRFDEYRGDRVRRRRHELLQLGHVVDELDMMAVAKRGANPSASGKSEHQRDDDALARRDFGSLPTG
jgi:hypothetical protein